MRNGKGDKDRVRKYQMFGDNWARAYGYFKASEVIVTSALFFLWGLAIGWWL